MRVFLTGASGQVGGAIAKHLVRRGFDVAGASHTRVCEDLAETVQIDLGSENAVARIRDAIERCDAIVHAAASLSLELFDPSIPRVNCCGTQQIIELAERWGARSVVYLSSVPVIGNPPQMAITEDHPVRPLTAYHASKVFGEHLVRLSERQDRSAVSLRITSPVGPGTPNDKVFSIFARRALDDQPLTVFGSGSRRQNYVDVRDVAMAVEECLLRQASGLYNIAGADSISDLDLAKTCIDVLGSRSAIEFLGSPNSNDEVVWNVSISKARRELEYVPGFTIEDSIRSLTSDR